MSEKRTYKAVVWVRDNVPGKRVTMMAESLTDARARLEGLYGEGHVYDLHNEEDAEATRLDHEAKR